MSTSRCVVEIISILEVFFSSLRSFFQIAPTLVETTDVDRVLSIIFCYFSTRVACGTLQSWRKSNSSPKGRSYLLFMFLQYHNVFLERAIHGSTKYQGRKDSSRPFLLDTPNHEGTPSKRGIHLRDGPYSRYVTLKHHIVDVVPINMLS